MSSPLGKLLDWLDDRAGVRSLVHEALYERVPGGARWRYVWGSTLVVAFATQMITGIFLWMAYSPSTQTAWESVFYIQYEMPGGWLLRGIHHYMAHAMVLLLGIHFAQVVWDGAYRAPRELNFVIGMILMLIVFALSLTGYLLPWDQKGYWATSVGTNLASQAPLAGPEIRKLAIGGTDYGHLTLTRFLALHAGVLPGLLIAMLVPHLLLFRRHGLHVKDPQHAPDTTFWPDQVLKDSVAALGVLVTVLMFAVYGGGAELTAPADPSNPFNAARPEWYFLFLFQFLKWFPGELEVWGAFVIPGVVVSVLFLMPWIGRSRAGHKFNVGLLVVVLGGIALLTAQAINDDNYAKWHERTEANAEKFDASVAFLEAKVAAKRDAERVIALARSAERIPPTGALSLMAADPFLQGPRLFAQYCVSCHSHMDKNDPQNPSHNLGSEKPTAPNLFGVGSRAWVAALLNPETVGDAEYLGYEGSPFAEGTMVDWVKTNVPDLDPEQVKKVVAALAAESDHPEQGVYRVTEREAIAEGVRLIKEEIGCVDCHKFQDVDNEGGAPDLTGYMSREWLTAFIRNPAAVRFYGENNDRMPAFGPHENPQLNQLDDESLRLIVDWLLGNWVVPGAEINPPAK
ncbi:MAG: cytochrome b N-terminal domain-containing protein [Bythopirellula sp.]|nr:cytochrome b N-terminal domain-containing protein [Bythopirellula sp.]